MRAYEIAWDYLARSGMIREEFEVCVFLVQRIMTMIGNGHASTIRMANLAISEYQRHLRECDGVARCGGCRGGSAPIEGTSISGISAPVP